MAPTRQYLASRKGRFPAFGASPAAPNSRKGQVLAFDASLAVIIMLFTAYIAFSVWSGIGIRAHEAQEREAQLSRTIAVADYLMKEGLVHKSGSPYAGISVSHSHLLERGKLPPIDQASLAEGAGLAGLCAELLETGQGPGCGGYEVCIRRPAVIYETGEAGYLVVCSK